MKKNILLKILIATVACFALSFLIAKGGGLNRDERFPNSIFKRYVSQFKCAPVDNSNSTTTIVKKFEAKEIHEVELTLINADVEVTKSASTATELHYNGAMGLKLSDQIEGSVLKLSDTEGAQKGWKVDCGPGWGKTGFYFNFNGPSTETSLKLELPPTIEKLTIHTVSGDLHVTNLQLKHLEIKTVSGDVHVTGSYPDLVGRTVSGDFVLNNDDLSPKIEITSTSGDLKLSFKKALDATVNASSVSGDFSVVGAESVSSDAGRLSTTKTFGKGRSQIALRTTSGDMRLELKE